MPVPGDNAQGFLSSQQVTDYLPWPYKGVAWEKMFDLDNDTDTDTDAETSWVCEAWRRGYRIFCIAFRPVTVRCIP